MMKQIKAYQLSKTELLADEIPSWYPDCPFGNLAMKYSFLLAKLNLLNETISEILELDEKKKKAVINHEYLPSKITQRPTILKIRFSSEIKIYTDELISIHSILKHRKTEGSWPKQVKPDSIAGVLVNIDNEEFTIYKPFEKILKIINGLGNAVKHSFINSETLWYRSYTPESHLIAFYNKHNNLSKNGIEPFEVKLLEFIEQYNYFLQTIKSELRNKYH